MCADKTHVNKCRSKFYRHNQSVVIPLDVEYVFLVTYVLYLIVGELSGLVSCSPNSSGFK